MKEDKREKMYRFLANEKESHFIEERYQKSSCESISAFFRQAIINDMIIQNSEEELKCTNLLLTSVFQKLKQIAEEDCISTSKLNEIRREVEVIWQQLQSIQSTLHKLKH